LGTPQHSKGFGLNSQALFFSLCLLKLVIGTPSAQLIRLKVLDDFMLNSGVYAISVLPPFNAKRAAA